MFEDRLTKGLVWATIVAGLGTFQFGYHLVCACRENHNNTNTG